MRYLMAFWWRVALKEFVCARVFLFVTVSPGCWLGAISASRSSCGCAVPKPADLPRYLKSSRVGGGGRMKEWQREELCSNEARQPLSASAVQARRLSEGATRAAQIVESSGSGETNEDPECTEGRRGRGERYKKYIYTVCIWMEFDPIRPKKILDTWWKVGFLFIIRLLQVFS